MAFAMTQPTHTTHNNSQSNSTYARTETCMNSAVHEIIATYSLVRLWYD